MTLEKHIKRIICASGIELDGEAGRLAKILEEKK